MPNMFPRRTSKTLNQIAHCFSFECLKENVVDLMYQLQFSGWLNAAYWQTRLKNYSNLLPSVHQNILK